jgi:predicted lipid-binding transport protein (Tim44 family)
MSELELFDYLAIAIIVALWWRFYDAAHPPGAHDKTLASLAMSGMIMPGAERRDNPPPAPPAVQETLRRIADAGGMHDTASFLAFVAASYETIVGAFAQSDLRNVTGLLTPAIRTDFEAFLTARRERGETCVLTFIGLEGADIVAAGIEDDTAWIDVRMAADLVSVSRDAEGRVIAGHADRVVTSAEIWTFERPLQRSGPAWRLAATNAAA